MITSIIPAQSQSASPKTVEIVDLKKYIGLWYEIAKIPNRFQKACVKGTTAEYKINADGTIEVLNSCIEEDGQRETAEGLAKVVDKRTNAKLEVSFFSILGIRPFWGDYWIIGLGKNYEYAVIGHPERKYGWILSRTPQMAKEKLDEAYNILNKNGYDTKKFVFTPQEE
jgi:apolipoprotein D and lipocalin family protein